MVTFQNSRMAGSVLGGKMWFPKSFRFYQQVRKGYIVLLPEVNPEKLDTNPLYKSGLPDFENISPEKCNSTFGKYILDFEHAVREAENKVLAPDKEKGIDIFEDVIDHFEEAGAQLESTWGLLKTLYTVDNKLMPHETYVPLHDRARKARSMKYTSRHLYNLFKGCDVSKLTEEEQRVVSKYRIEGKLNGLELGAEGSELFAQISNKLARERDDFSRRVKISASKYSHLITDGLVTREFPEDLRQTMANRNGKEVEGPWRVDLSMLNRFLKFCPDRKLRWNVWLASRQVASIESGSELNNSATIETIRKYRRDIANILGYISYAHMSMETKMAGSLAKVNEILDILLDKAREFQEKEIIEMQDFAEDRGFRGKLELWDIPFWERRQKFELYSWDERIVREYFPYEKVMSGLIEMCSERFALRFEESSARTWHQDVKLYHIYDQESSKPIAGLYIDPFDRAGKVRTPGQVVCMRPSARATGPSPPLAAIVFSLPPATSAQPCLVNFEEVEVIFQKFGQALQQVLSTTNYMEVSGLSYIEWDAVEVVSNIMSLWLNDPEVLSKVSGHYKTHEPLPVRSLEEVRRHNSGIKLSNEIYKANLDLQLHHSTEFWNKIVQRLWPEHYIFDLYPKDYHVCNFVQPFAGEFGAAYFSHIWAKMLAEDAYLVFKSEKEKKSIGTRFRDTFLGFGGACQPSEVFRRFQGRDPSHEALLASIGKKVVP